MIPPSHEQPVAAIGAAVQNGARRGAPVSTCRSTGHAAGCIVRPDLFREDHERSNPSRLADRSNAVGCRGTFRAWPSRTALVGTQLHHQMLVGEVNSALFTSLASSNGLRLTLGAF